MLKLDFLRNWVRNRAAASAEGLLNNLGWWWRPLVHVEELYNCHSGILAMQRVSCYMTGYDDAPAATIDQKETVAVLRLSAPKNAEWLGTRRAPGGPGPPGPQESIQAY